MKYITIMVLRLAALWLGLLGGYADAADELPHWQLNTSDQATSDQKRADQKTAENQLLRGAFSQIKRSKHLTRGIKSSGTVVISPTLGIAWQTLSPVKTTLVISHSGIVAIDSSDRRKKLAAGGELNLLFGNAMMGNWDLLKAHFTLTSSVSGGSPAAGQTEPLTDRRYCVELQPSTALLQQNVKQITVCGSQYQIDQMTIEELSGTFTETTLDLTPSPTFTPQELALFDRALFDSDVTNE